MTPRIHAVNIRDEPPADAGARILVDRLWPRGLSKAAARLDAWSREVAPSTELRKWSNHDPAKWKEFVARYRAELDANPAVGELLDRCRRGPVTLLYSARDRDHNQAVALRDYLLERLESEREGG